MSKPLDLSRRDFLFSITITGGALQAWPVMNLFAKTGAGVMPSVSTPVISFHMDQPYLDLTGTATPYFPPAGTGSAQAVGGCDDEFLRYHYCYAI